MQNLKHNYFVRLRLQNQAQTEKAQAEKNTKELQDDKSYSIRRLNVRRARSFKLGI